MAFVTTAVGDKWVQKSDIPTPRWGMAVSAVNGRIYVIGGTIAFPSPLATVEEYTPDGWPFSVSSQDKLITKWAEIKSRY